MSEIFDELGRRLVVLVGAGPGEAQLITAAGAKWLSQADCVVYDRLVGEELLSLARGDAELIYAGKDPARQATPQERINQLLIDRCLAGRLVVRLKGGDPYVFGRGGEEADALAKAGCAFRVVPGVTAAIVAAAYEAGRADWITFTSSATVDNFVALARLAGAGIGGARLAAIGPVTAETLRRRGLQPAVVAEQYTVDGLLKAILAAEAGGAGTHPHR